MRAGMGLLKGVAWCSLIVVSSCEGLDLLNLDAAQRRNYTYCGSGENWEPEWEMFEEEVLELINDVRSRGADCHSKGTFPAVGPLSLNEEIRCAARSHSMDMALREYFDHTNPDGEQPWDRMAEEGYEYYAAGENIAAGFATPATAVAAWLASDGHCANLMAAGYLDTGVGFYVLEDSYYTYYWTQDFGSQSR